MSNSGRKTGTPGWRAFALLGGVLVVAFGAFASATPQEKSAATLAPAVEKTKASSLTDQAAAVAGQFQSANSTQDSSTAFVTAQGRKPEKSSPAGLDSVAAVSEGQRTAQAGGNTVTCSVNKDITPLNSVACAAGGITTANQFARCFDGATHFPAAVTVTSLDIGIEVAEDGGASNMLTATLYSIPACGPTLPDAQLTPLGSGQIDPGTDGSANGTILTIVFAPPIAVPAGTNVVAEVAYGDNTRIWPGSNPNGQSCLSYIAADACGFFDLTDLTPIAPTMHLVLNLNVQLGACGNGDCEEGEDTCGCPEDCGDGNCGDGICCASEGEDCVGCPEDCGDCPFCGDGEVNGDEECEPGDLCPGNLLCLPAGDPDECTCPANENDDCENRTPIFDGSTAIDTTTATTDGLPTNGLGDCNAFNDPQIHNDIWFNYTATCNGELTVSTCDTVDYDSKIAIYDDCDIGLCPRGGDEIGCNDDGLNCGGFTSIATAGVLEGNCYKIRIGGFSAADSGSGTVNIDCVFQAVCGDNNCDEGEDTCNCEVDCGADECGTGICCEAQGEDCINCEQDCGECPAVCGNDECEEGEDCCNCELDCGACSCGDGTCDAPCESFINCSADCGGPPECTIFTNKAEFEAFNNSHGKGLKGIEDFENMPPGTVVAGFDDPLCGGIPTTPPVFPNGILQLNLCLQSNLLAGAPDNPDPRGVNALVAVELGSGFGETSDLVLANTFVDSFDMMFGDPVPPDQQDNHTGVGFNTVTLLGGASVEIRVYDKSNILLAEDTAPADTAGTNFWGIWCSSTIGRLNIFDPAGGAEGGDNIQLWVDLPCVPECPAGSECIAGTCCGDGKVEGAEECEPGGCGDCPTDTNGDGITNATDLAQLLGNWGPCAPGGACVCLDANGDGIINATDLAQLLGNWGPCPDGPGGDPCNGAGCLDNCQCVGLGACCGGPKGPDSCEALQTAEECAADGGHYAGDDSICDDCPDAACFDAEGSCFEAHPNPGCNNLECCGLVCNVDPFCCIGNWDGVCVGEAEKFCPPPSCGDGNCDPGEDSCSCELDCGPPAVPCCISQLPNQVNGIFSDLDCELCGTGIQVLAEQFVMVADSSVDIVRFWGGYFPDDLPLAVDCITIIFREDAAGLPGAIINQLTCVDATSRVATGIELFGVDEYVYEVDLVPNKALAAGTYWVEIYNDTGSENNTDSWFWETGDQDPVLGIPGQAFSFTIPEEPWNFDAATDMAYELVCVE